MELQLILFYKSDQGTEAPRVTTQFLLMQFEYVRFGVYARKLQMAVISSQIILNNGKKNHEMKNREKALPICSKSVQPSVRQRSDLVKMRCIKSTENSNLCCRN